MQADPQLLLEFPATISTLQSPSLPLLPSASAYDEQGNVDTNGHLEDVQYHQPEVDNLQ